MEYFDRFTPFVYFRRSPDGPIKEESFQPGRGVRESTGGTFDWKPIEKNDELKGRLSLNGSEAVYFEGLELRLSARDLRKSFVSLHDDISPDSGLRLFQHGYHSWSWTGARKSSEKDAYCRLKWKRNIDENPETPFQGILPFSLPLNVLPAPGKFYSEFLVMLETQTKYLKPKHGKSILFTTSGPGDQFVKFRIHLDPRSGKLEEFAIIWEGGGQLLPPHSIISLTPVKHANTVGDSRLRSRSDQTDPAEFLDDSISRIAKNFDTPRMQGSVTGWCSWYYYYNKISEGQMLRNLRLIKEKQIDVDFFQIDDGWQKNIGDWTQTGSSFPSGMKFLADVIYESGLKPGIWLAPCVARPDSDLVKDHPEIVLLDAEEDPVTGLYNPLWGGRTVALDVTHPKYKQWLSDTIATISGDWGYQYLKLDFLYAACYRGGHYEARTPPAIRLRETLELVRRVAGKKAFLVGCGCPIMPSIGPMDAMRIGRDVNSIWGNNLLAKIIKDRNYPTAEGCLQNAITRSFMHRRFFVNDPDCILVRDNRTDLTLDQVYLMASVMSITGGMILLSDDLETIAPDRLNIFKTALEIHKRCANHTALPLGLMDASFPPGIYNPAGYVGVWNNKKRPRRIRLTLPDGLARKLRGTRNIWNNERIPWTISENQVEVSLAPYESVLVRL